MRILSKPFGKLPNGAEVFLFTLSNKNGIIAEITNYGGIIVSLKTPDRNQSFDDVILGYDSFKYYIKNPHYFGAIIGRIANRIEGACFTLNGIYYELNKNERDNHIHGGLTGFDRKVWDVRILSDGINESLELSLFSEDGDEEYPGNLEVRVIYSLTDHDELKIQYFAVSDKDTVVNLTNHAYFNLSGNTSSNVLSHYMKLNSEFYTPITPQALPTGEILSVKNTPFDFTSLRPIGDGIINHSQNQQLIYGAGYDHNFVLRVSGDNPEEIAEVYEPESGRVMKVLTTKPGVQFYSGNFLHEAGIGKGGKAYDRYDGFCLETQYFPNSIKYRHFPSPILKAGDTYHHTTIYRFLINNK